MTAASDWLKHATPQLIYSAAPGWNLVSEAYGRRRPRYVVRKYSRMCAIFFRVWMVLFAHIVNEMLLVEWYGRREKCEAASSTLPSSLGHQEKGDRFVTPSPLDPAASEPAY